jgi:calcineurin-like phosphoesterase family protein
MNRYWFTADEHYGHRNILHYCAETRGKFASIGEMDAHIIEQNNLLVKPGDIVVHVGDFTLSSKAQAADYVRRLKGQHVFLVGSHDYWLRGAHSHEIWEHSIEGQHVVACHYAMRVWPRSHYNSFQLYGHSHSHLPPAGKQLDVGVDGHGFKPWSFDEIVAHMAGQPDNFNFIPENKRSRDHKTR